MNKLIVGYNVHGYKEVEITDDVIKNDRSELVLVIDSSNQGSTRDYYLALDAAIRLNSEIILLTTDRTLKLFKVLASLMVSFRRYNIYEIASKDIITNNYLGQILNRKPDFNEVQAFIDGEITCYSDISTLMIGIESLLDEGDLEGLKVFFEQHMESMESLSVTFDTMKAMCEELNASTLNEKISILSSSLDKCREDYKSVLEKNSALKTQSESLQASVAKLKSDVEELKGLNESLKAEAGTGGVIKSFTAFNTAVVSTKVKHIIYFKEVSYVRFTNSLVKILMQELDLGDLRSKLVIYDNRTKLYKVYGGLNIIDGKKYSELKTNNQLGLIKEFVVSEPASNIIEDLVSMDDVDVLIVYDKMKFSEDVVKGNNVTKFHVLNSKTELNALAQDLNIIDNGSIITSSDADLGNEVLDIPQIKDYKVQTDSAKHSKYRKLKTAISKKLLLEAILERAKIQLDN